MANTIPTWTHKGTEITLSSAGTFQCHKNGQRLSAPSLAALKKRLDDAAAFEAFDAYVEESGWH